MVYLNGGLVSNLDIIPGEHIFLGTFRSPSPPCPNGAALLCPCGRMLETQEGVRQHWQDGHFDVPTYGTIP